MALKKRVVRSGVPETGGPFNLGVVYGPLLFVSGLPPFRADYARQMREARARGERPPAYVPEPFDDQVRVVMDHVKQVVEAAGSNMDCLLKVIVWLKDQTKAESFDRIYRGYFSSEDALPTRTRMQAGARRWTANWRSRRSATCRARAGVRLRRSPLQNARRP